MNLLLFIHSMQAGGAERASANLANYWADKGWQVTVVTLTSDAGDFYQLHPLVQRIALDVASSSHNPLSAVINNLYRIWRLHQTLQQVKPRAAIAMMSNANIMLAIAAFGMRDMLTLGSERTYPPCLPLGRVWEWLRYNLYGSLGAVVAQTHESASWLREHTRARRVPVIPNAVAWPLPLQEPKLPIPTLREDQHRLLGVGRLSEEKGFEQLIFCFQQVADDFPFWELVILGEGPLREVLEAQIQQAGLSDRVFLPGRAGNVGEWYEASDIYVMSSRFEGFPNTLIEAMAYGLPAVSFDCDTGPRDIIRPEVDGVLVPAADGHALEQALRRLMGDASLRAEWGARAIEVRERFSTPRIMEMWEGLIV